MDTTVRKTVSTKFQESDTDLDVQSELIKPVSIPPRR